MEHHYLDSCLGHFWIMLEPFLANNFFQTSQALKYSRLNHHCPEPVSMIVYIRWPCLDLVLTISGLALLQGQLGLLNLKKLSLHGLRLMSIECLLFGIKSGPCMGHD